MYAQVENPKESKSRAVANSVVQEKRNGQGLELVDNRPIPYSLKAIQLSNRNMQTTFPQQVQKFNCVQMNGSDSDSDYMEEDSDAPEGYMDPSDYHDEYGGSDHSDLEGKAWAAKLDNSPALWWKDPNETTELTMTGSRAQDVTAAGGDDQGFTWHHCKDYHGGKCTFQQVPTTEHGSWGHKGGVDQYESATGVAYT